MIARDTDTGSAQVCSDSSPTASTSPQPRSPARPSRSPSTPASTSSSTSSTPPPRPRLRPHPPVIHPAVPALNPLARMTTIHSLPVELLTRIFTLGAQDPVQDFCLGPAAPIPRDPPFEVLVSHVCPQWRDIALRTPHLWTSIALTQVSHIARARAYVARSARLPFHILLDSAAENDYVHNHSIFRDEFLPAFEPLTPHIARWRSLILRVRDIHCKRHARTVLSTVGPAPLLRALELWHIEEWANVERLWGHVGPPPVVVFDGALPALSRLSLIGVNIQWSEHASPFLRGLTELELGVHSDDVRIPFDRWLAVLARSPALARLALHYSGPRLAAPPWRLPDGPVPLPALRDLKLADLDAAYACALLRTFVAPATRKLYLELGWMDTPQDYSVLVDMLVDAPDPDACPDVLDPSTLYAPPEPPEPGAGTGKGKRAARPMFPLLEELTVKAVATCTLASWHGLLRASPHVHTLAVDFGQMGRGAFEVLAGTLVPPFPLVTHYDAMGFVFSIDPVAVAARNGHAGRAPNGAAELLLPNLRTLRVSGVSGAALHAYYLARRRAGRPIRRLFVREKDRDRDMERMKAEVDAEARAWQERRGGGAGVDVDMDEEEPCRMEWFRDEEDDEFEQEEGGEEALEETEGEEGENDGLDGGADEGEGEGGEEGGEEMDGEGADVPWSGSDDASSENHEDHHTPDAQTPTAGASAS